MLRQTKEHPVTYLNKGQTYSLTVVDSKPPVKSVRLLKYRTFVRVTFEEQDQRSNPIASWQLWEEGRGLNEAYKRKIEPLAVEYVESLQESTRYHGNYQIQLEKASVDGFCVTWTADPNTKVLGCTIPLRFNFLSTDFSRSKGVKGVLVRLSAKTKSLHSEGEKELMEHDSEMCYCVVKLFRDHGAQRKTSNDVAHLKKKIEKLNKQIAVRELGSDSGGPSHAYNPTNVGQLNHPPQKRKWSMKPRKSKTTDNDLYAELALMHELFSSAREVSVLRLRGDEQDDPDLHPVTLPRGTSTLSNSGYMNNQHLESTSVTLTSKTSVQSSTKSYEPVDRLQSSVNLQPPLEIPKVSVGALQGSPLPAKLSFKTGSYHNDTTSFHALLTLSQ